MDIASSWNIPIVWIVVLSAVAFLASIVLVWIVIIHMPVDYLTPERKPEETRFSGRPLIRVCIVVVKNLVGLLFVMAGIIMLFTPGQGVMFIFIGVTLLDFPGKRSLIRRMVSRRRVLTAINRIRTKSHKPPLEVPSCE